MSSFLSCLLHLAVGSGCVHICSIYFFFFLISSNIGPKHQRSFLSLKLSTLRAAEVNDNQVGQQQHQQHRKLTTVELFLKCLIRLCHSLLEEHDSVFAWSDIINLKFASVTIAHLAPHCIFPKTSWSWNMIDLLECYRNMLTHSPICPLGKAQYWIVILKKAQVFFCFFF